MSGKVLGLHPADEQMPCFKAVYEGTNGMIGTFGDYASTVDGFMLQVLLQRGATIKRFTEILKLDSATWKILDCDADLGKYNRWLSVYAEQADAFSTGWGAACGAAAKMASGCGDQRLAARLSNLGSEPNLLFLLLPEIEGEDELPF